MVLARRQPEFPELPANGNGNTTSAALDELTVLLPLLNETYCKETTRYLAAAAQRRSGMQIS